MDVLAQMRLCGDGVDQLAAGILGVARHKADLVIPRHLAQKVQQVGEIHGLCQPLAVAVDILPQQGDLLVAVCHQVPELRQDGAGFPAAFPPPHIRYNTIGAEVVATIHDRQPGAKPRIPSDGQFLDHRVPLLRHLQVAFAAPQTLRQHGGQPVDAVHTEHQVHIRITLAQLFHDMRLLRHAAADTDDQFRVLFLQFFQRADIAEHPLLCMFPHRAGVEQDQVGVLQRIAQPETHVLQNAADLLTVVDILLAAVAAHIGHRRRLVISRQRFRRRTVMRISQFFQVNSP